MLASAPRLSQIEVGAPRLNAMEALGIQSSARARPEHDRSVWMSQLRQLRPDIRVRLP